MNRSTALVVVTAVLFTVSAYIAPLNENRQLDFVNHPILAWLSIILVIPALIAGMKTSYNHFKTEVAAEKTVRDQKLLRSKF